MYVAGRAEDMAVPQSRRTLSETLAAGAAAENTAAPSPRDAQCPACGEGRGGAIVAVPDREYRLAYLASYFTCAACGTCFQSPMPDVDQLAAFYPPTYHAQTSSGLLDQARQALRLRRLRPLMRDEGVVLDFGCGNGAFLSYAAERLPGHRYVGFEIADHPMVEVTAGGAVTLVRGRIADLLATLPPCRLITMNHVIEHLPNPLADVAALAAKLMPGGAIEGQTPAAGSLEHRVFGTCWSGYHAPRHTVVFSPTGLRCLLRRAGLESVEVGGAFNPAGLAVSLAAAARRRSGRDIRRRGLGWLFYLAGATALAPLDLAIGPPGIQSFLAFRPRS